MKNTEKRPGDLEVDLPIYLDYNATTPVDPVVITAMEPFFRSHFGNPSSSHHYGAITRTAIEKARTQVAQLIGAKPQEIIFTSGGTESNNMALQGIAWKNRERGRHIIISQVEHPAVMEVTKYLEYKGFTITRVPVDAYGSVSVESIEKAIRKETQLISIMHANNEVGTVQPIEEIGKLARKKQIYFHCDAAQSIGKIPVDVNAMQVDLLSIAGHKLYAPKGVGALYIREGVSLEKIYHGADHEQNARPGTENVLEIVGLGAACELVGTNFDDRQKHLRETRDELEDLLVASFPEMRINGHPDDRLPNTLNVSFKNLEASTLLMAMSGVAASAGAACHADDIDVSPVLEAMGLPVAWSMGTIRFSTGHFLTIDQVRKAHKEIEARVKEFLPEQVDSVVQASEMSDIKLTQYTHGLGCACKLRPQDLEQVLKNLPVVPKSEVLVGPETADDAAVYLVHKDLAMVQTVDFFTPVVDDPYLFGAVAAANALSDVYAMGAEPTFALNIVGFPSKRLPLSVLESILMGAADKAKEAGIPILGGHTIEDNEPKFGMVVTGFVHPDKLWKNEGAQVGDVLLLTKPIGIGILSTAQKRGLLSPEKIEEIGNLMARLNGPAATIAKDFDIHACTDITGFGLLGHLKEVLEASKVSAELWYDHIPFIEGVETLVAGGVVPGGTKNNLNFVKEKVDFRPGISQTAQYLLADAQTSGGLVFSLPAEQYQELKQRLEQDGIMAALIGKVVPPTDKLLIIKPQQD